MTVTLEDRPGTRPRDGGLPARRAVIRWALRLLRREWRQQLLILALVTVAVGATVVGATVATDAQAPAAGTLGTASDAATVTGPPPAVAAGIAKIRRLYGRAGVIENESVPVPGTEQTFDLRAQDPKDPFGGPMLTLVSGRYPATARQTAVTQGVANDFHLAAGRPWTIGGRTYTVTGIVQNPQSLLDEFALVIPGQVTAPSSVTVLFDARSPAAGIAARTGLDVTDAASLANANVINPETISVAAAVLGMLLIALVGAGGFSVLAQRRLRAIGMLAAQGATERHIRLAVRANGAATGLAGAAAGLVLGFAAWLVYRPFAETSAHHVMGVFQLPWTVTVLSGVLAVIATYVAASRPAKAIARVPVVAALAGRPPEPGKTRHLAVPVGAGCAAGAFALLGVAGAAVKGGSSMGPVIGGFVLLAAAIVLLAPALLSAVAATGKRSPVAVRLALRDLARYRARSGPALAAISLATLIAVIICVVSAARFGNVLDFAGPNLAANQLIVHAPQAPPPGPGPNSGSRAGSGPGSRSGQAPAGKHSGQARRRAALAQGNAAPPVSLAQATRTADQIAGSLGVPPSRMLPLLETSATLLHAAAGRNWDGPVFEATPRLLSTYGIKPSQVNSAADILTMRPGLSAMTRMQLLYGRATLGQPWNSATYPCPAGSCVPAPPVEEVSQLPSGTSAPNTVITAHAVSEYHLQSSFSTEGWLITVPGGLSAAQITRAEQIAAGASGMSVETRNSVPSLRQIIDVATVFGIVLALGILGMSVGLVRAEAGRDLRALTAAGASGRVRRTITATTAGTLALTGAVIGLAGGYLAAIGFFRGNDLDGLSSLSAVPAGNLLAILVGMPLAATVLGWLLSGREPAALSRQPLE